MENNVKMVTCGYCCKLFTTKKDFGELAVCPHCGTNIIIV